MIVRLVRYALLIVWCSCLAHAADAQILKGQWELIDDNDPMSKSAKKVAVTAYALKDGGSIEGRVFCDEAYMPGVVAMEMAVFDVRYIVRRSGRNSIVPLRLRFDDEEAIQTASEVLQYANVAQIYFVPVNGPGRVALMTALSTGVAYYPIELLAKHRRVLFEAQLETGRSVVEIDFRAPAISAVIRNCRP